MSRTAITEYLRRALTLLLLTLGLIAFGKWGQAVAWPLIGAGLLFYIFLPRETPPDKALVYERMPAVVGPDIIGFLLSSVLIALPFWAGMGNDAYLWEDFPLVHPSAILSWPIALISLYILVIAVRFGCFWLVIEPDGLRISTVRGQRQVSFGQVESVRPFRKGLPRWMKALAPLLAMSGKYTAAGAIMLARDASGISLRLKDGSSVDINVDAFEQAAKRVIKTLRKQGIPVDAEIR